MPVNTLNLTIESTSRDSIKASFDRIAEDLLNNWKLNVNGQSFRFTEIEFYYFIKDIHEDNFTHRHDFEEGQFRYHSQGIDITFESSDKKQCDGGILLRGIKFENKEGKTEYINGPKKIWTKIFGELKLYNENSFGLIYDPVEENKIPKTTVRKGLTEKSCPEFHKEKYRYYIDENNWEKKIKLADYLCLNLNFSMNNPIAI
jgi:hypothetical protein